MEPFPPKSTENPVSASRPKKPPGLLPSWQVKKKTHNNTRELGKKLHHNGRAQSPLPSDCTKASSDAAGFGAFQPVTSRSPEEDQSNLASERQLESSERWGKQLSPENQKSIRRGLLAEKYPTTLAARQPQIFNLSTNLSRGDALTERATGNLDIYEVDWHNLEFKPLVPDEARAIPSASAPVTSSGDNPVAHSLRRHSFNCCPSDLNTTILPKTPTEQILEHFSATPTNSWPRACPWLEGGVFSNDTSTFDSTRRRRAASWERVRKSNSGNAHLRNCSWPHRGRCVSPETSANVRKQALHLERNSSNYTDVIEASAAPQVSLFPCRMWTFLSAGHTFLRLERVNCSGTPLKGEAVQAFAALVRLKHLTLAGCSLKDLNFLSEFVNAVPLQSLVAPFNQIDTLLVTDCAQPAFSSGPGGVGSKCTPTLVHDEGCRNLQQGTLRAVVESEASGLGAYWRKHGKERGLTGGRRCLGGVGQIHALQCGHDRVVEPRDDGLEGRSGPGILADAHDKIHNNSVQRGELAETVQIEESTAEEQRRIVARNAHGGNPGGDKLRRDLADPVAREDEPAFNTSSEKELIFPNSLRVVDLSYNCLGDARELLLFCCNFDELREIKVCGNYLHTEPSSLLKQIGYTLRSKGVTFCCKGKQTQEEEKHDLTEDLSNSCTYHGTFPVELAKGKQIVPCSSFPQRAHDVREVKKESTSSPATSPCAGDELQHLQQLVKQLAREKAMLAEELKEAQRLNSQRGRETASACKKIRDADQKLCATPQRCDETSCMGGRLCKDGNEFRLRQRSKAPDFETKTNGLDPSVCEGGGEIEENSRYTDAPLGSARRRRRYRSRDTVSYNNNNNNSRINNSSACSSLTEGRHTSCNCGSPITANNAGKSARRRSYSNGTIIRNRSCIRASRRSSSSSSGIKCCRAQATAAVHHFPSCPLFPSRQESPVPFSVDDLSLLQSFLFFVEAVKSCPTEGGYRGSNENCLNGVNGRRPSSSPAAGYSTVVNEKITPFGRRSHTGTSTVSGGSSGFAPLYPTEGENVWKKEGARRHREMSLSEAFTWAGVRLADVTDKMNAHNWTGVGDVLGGVKEKAEGVKTCLLHLCSKIQVLKEQATETRKKCLIHLRRLRKARRAFIYGLKQLDHTGEQPKFYTALIEKLEKLEYILGTMWKNRQTDDKGLVTLRVLRASQELSPGALYVPAEVVSPALAKQVQLLKAEAVILEEMFHKHVNEKSAAVRGLGDEKARQPASGEEWGSHKALQRLRQLEKLLVHRFRAASLTYFDTLAKLLFSYERSEELQQDWEAINVVRSHLQKVCPYDLTLEGDYEVHSVTCKAGGADATCAATEVVFPAPMKLAGCRRRESKQRDSGFKDTAETVVGAERFFAPIRAFSGRQHPEENITEEKRYVAALAEADNAAAVVANAISTTAQGDKQRASGTRPATEAAIGTATDAAVTEVSTTGPTPAARIQWTATAGTTERADSRIARRRDITETILPALPLAKTAAASSTLCTAAVAGAATVSVGVTATGRATPRGDQPATAEAATTSSAAAAAAVATAGVKSSGDSVKFPESIQSQEWHLSTTGAPRKASGPQVKKHFVGRDCFMLEGSRIRPQFGSICIPSLLNEKRQISAHGRATATALHTSVLRRSHNHYAARSGGPTRVVACGEAQNPTGLPAAEGAAAGESRSPQW